MHIQRMQRMIFGKSLKVLTNLKMNKEKKEVKKFADYIKKNMQILLLYFHNLDNENGDESVGDDEEEFEDEEDEEMTVMKEVVMNFSDIEKR